MAIDDSGEWWVGSDPGDIEPYLKEFTNSEVGYPTTAFRLVECPCGSERFQLVRAGSLTQSTCSRCGLMRFISEESIDDVNGSWEEAIEDEEPESYKCVDCGSLVTNVGLGFAGYRNNPELDAVQWFYLGVRCASCGILGCFNDGKVGWGPVADVYIQMAEGSVD